MYRKTHCIPSLIVEVRIKWRYNGLDMFICWYVLCHNFCNLLYIYIHKLDIYDIFIILVKAIITFSCIRYRNCSWWWRRRGWHLYRNWDIFRFWEKEWKWITFTVMKSSLYTSKHLRTQSNQQKFGSCPHVPNRGRPRISRKGGCQTSCGSKLLRSGVVKQAIGCSRFLMGW